MIEDLLKLKQQVETMIETYKDLHSDEEYETHDRGNNTHLDGMSEYNEKQRALKRIREGYYESTFREKQGKNTTKSGKGSSSLCVYGDT